MRNYIFKYVQSKGETYISEVARRFGITPSCARYHLNKLVDKGKIECRKFWEDGTLACGSYKIVIKKSVSGEET